MRNELNLVFMIDGLEDGMEIRGDGTTIPIVIWWVRGFDEVASYYGVGIESMESFPLSPKWRTRRARKKTV